MLQNSYISHNKSPYNTHIFSYKAVFKSTAVLSNRIAVDSCGKRRGQGLLSHSRWAQVYRFGCNDVSRIIQQLRSIPCNNQQCDGGGWWNDACEVCLRRRNGYLRLVVVWEPSLMASWLMCCRSSSLVFFGRQREVSGDRRRMRRLNCGEESVTNKKYLLDFFPEDHSWRFLKIRVTPDVRFLCSRTFYFYSHDIYYYIHYTQ